ncbi:hypothetical protein EVAR_58850_1 [Eumeta japonica]|uniref:Uncharacterized protein n=1 Tax=Eumeta variegata TaxID=151549 RepID=A0A4C1YA14_EUMVA|nr:hypothetical protein EVAR_58850_1 [Eumeta japonica]
MSALNGQAQVRRLGQHMEKPPEMTQGFRGDHKHRIITYLSIYASGRENLPFSPKSVKKKHQYLRADARSVEMVSGVGAPHVTSADNDVLAAQAGGRAPRLHRPLDKAAACRVPESRAPVVARDKNSPPFVSSLCGGSCGLRPTALPPCAARAGLGTP